MVFYLSVALDIRKKNNMYTNQILSKLCFLVHGDRKMPPGSLPIPALSDRQTGIPFLLSQNFSW